MKTLLDRRLVCVFLVQAIALGTAFVGSQVSAAEPKSIEVTQGVLDWVVQESTGRVFASLTDSDEVVEYSASAGEVRRFKVGASPIEMIVKGDRLVVACVKSSALHVIDLKANKDLGAIALTGKGPQALFCSRVDNGFVYCFCHTGSSSRDSEVFQCDLNSMKIRKQRGVRGWGQSYVLHVAMSHDGNWIIPDGRGAVSPSGADLMKVDEDEFTFTQLRHLHESVGPIAATPSNRFWVLGNSLYSLDITKAVRSFAGSPVAVHPNLDLAVSKTSTSIALERFSDSSPIATVPIDTDPKKGSPPANEPRRNRGPVAADTTIQFDLKNNLVFVGEPSRGSWIDIAEVAGKLPALMMVTVPTEVSSLVSKPLRIPLTVTKGEEKTKLEIVNGPKSAKLEGETFVWQPQAENVGFTTIQFALKSATGNRTLDSAEMIVKVTLPKIDFGFQAKSMEVAPGGRYVVVWGASPGEENRHPAHTGPDDVSVIDVQDMKVLARQKFPQGVRCAAIDDEHVYVSPNSGNLVTRWDRSLTESERMFLQVAPAQLIRIGGDQLAAVGESIQIIDTKTMQPAPGPQIRDRNNPASMIRVLSQNEVQVGDRILDSKSGKTLSVLNYSSLPLLVRPVAQQRPNMIDLSQPPPRWGRRVTGQMLANYKGSGIAQWPGQRSATVSERWPMAILISSTQNQGMTATTMELANLVDGTPALTSVIDVSTPNQNAGIANNYGMRNTLLVGGNQVFVLKGTELLVATIPQALAQAMPMPVHFLRQPPTEIEVGPTAKLTLAVAGKTKGVKFSLLAEYPGVELDSNSGELRINTSELWSKFAEQAVTYNAQGNFDGRSPPISSAENAKSYKELTGKDLPEGKLATHIPVSAALLDPEAQEDGTQFSIVVIGPRKEIDEAIAKRASQIAAKQAEMTKELALKQAQQKKEAEEAKSDKERLDALEARIRRIEAALDSILKRLPEKQE